MLNEAHDEIFFDFDKYTNTKYNIANIIRKESKLEIYDVVIRKKLQIDLKKFPKHIIAKLTSWISAVVHDGLTEVRKIAGYHDEPLQ